MSAQRKAFVTGAAGFCGRHLSNHLLECRYQVFGFDKTALDSLNANFFTGDINDTLELKALLKDIQPNAIFHLAALTDSRRSYQELHQVNALGTLSLLEAIREACPTTRVLVTSSSAVYGRVLKSEIPIVEDQVFRPTNLYGVSKIAQEMLAFQQINRYGLKGVITRAFNITGPGESRNFVTSAFAYQIALIEAGISPPILEVGNLDSVRDFLDVRDVVCAYERLLSRGGPGVVYNVCSSQGTPIYQLLKALLELSSVKNIQIYRDPSRLQPSDVPFQIGSSLRLRSTAQWKPTTTFRQTLKDVLNFWRGTMNEEGE